jgi:hypothetical protein
MDCSNYFLERLTQIIFSAFVEFNFFTEIFASKKINPTFALTF